LILEDYKVLKVFTVDEMILLNSNLNYLNPEELFFTLKLKLNAIPDLLNNIYNLMDYENLAPVEGNYFDLYFE